MPVPASKVSHAGRLSICGQEGLTNLACFPSCLCVCVRRYTHLLRLIESTRDFEEQEQVERADTIKAALTSNLALAAFNQEEYVRCIEWCDKTLQADPNNAKVGRSKGWAQPHLSGQASRRHIVMPCSQSVCSVPCHVSNTALQQLHGATLLLHDGGQPPRHTFCTASMLSATVFNIVLVKVPF